MKRFSTAFGMVGILVATTVGAGIFTLPWIFAQVGLLWGVVFCLVVAGLIAFAEYTYWRVLIATGERGRLVGLVRTYLGRAWGMLSLVAVACGMFFALVIYLVLAERFLKIVLPLSGRSDLIIFWIAAVLPAAFSIRRFAIVETIGTILKCLLIFFVFFVAGRNTTPLPIAPVPGIAPLFAFGAILFALGGWNAVEPMYELWKDGGSAARRIRPAAIITGGVLGIAALYLFFAIGILGSLPAGTIVAADTLSGLAGWPLWQVMLLACLGLLALWTAYGPTAREIEHALSKDLRVNSVAAFALVALVPFFAVFGGFVNLIQALVFAGALFGGVQYVAIFALGEKLLQPRPTVRWAMRLAAAVFALAALYEVYQVVVH